MISPQVIRQALIMAGMMCCSISEGYILGQMAGMVAGLLSKDSDIMVSETNVSLIASVSNLTCIVGFVVAGVLAEKFGRRVTIAVFSALNVINWIAVSFAQSVAVLLATSVTVGVGFGVVLMLTTVATAEYMPPNIRGLCLSFVNSVGVSFGVMLAHILSILFHWRKVALIGTIPAGLSVIIPMFWVESPQWLASKGKYDECARSFRALHSHRDTCDEELRTLIESERRKVATTTDNRSLISMPILRSAVKKKFFWMVLFLNLVISMYTTATGSVPFQAYAITMLQEMTGVEDVLWFTVVVDGLSLTGSCISCFLLGVMKMRTVLFACACAANVLLVVLSATLYFKSDNTLLQWLSCIFLGLYFVLIYAGPIPVVSAYIVEIIPIELKGFYFCTGGFVCGAASFVSVMFTPALVKKLDYSGTFLLNTAIMSICLACFWKNLPETKGKSLQQIEFHFKKNYIASNLEDERVPQDKLLPKNI